MLGLRVLLWLIPFVAAFIRFPLRGPARPLFESIMAVTVTGSAVLLGLAWLGWARTPRFRFRGAGR